MFRDKLFTARLSAVENSERADAAEKRVEELETHIFEIQRDLVKAQNRLGELQILAGNNTIEDKISAATNYEFGMRVIRKQLEDQLLYISGGDEKLISTMQFESIEALCRNTICLIDILLQTNHK